MYLLLGDVNSAICAAALELLKVQGFDALVIENPLAIPCRFAWRFGTSDSASWLRWDDGKCISDRDIEGVLVGRPKPMPADGWKPADLRYAEIEYRAALLAWLWSLDCPVINRYPPLLWFHPDTPLLFWQAGLGQCGLYTLPSLISNAEPEIHDFIAGLDGRTAYAPLTYGTRYMLDADFDRDQLATIQNQMPVHLTQAPMASQSACVIGSRVIWDGSPPSEMEKLELALKRFCALPSLDFVEFAIASTAEGARVAAVKAFPGIEKFGLAAQRGIVTALVQLLTRAKLSPAEPVTRLE